MVAGGAALVIWLPILPGTQAEQQLRSLRVEQDMKASRIADALDVMSARRQSDFPPYWDPPPREGYDERSPHIFDVMEVLLARDRAPWLRATYLDKFRRHLATGYWFYGNSDEELATLVLVLSQLPEGPTIATGLREGVKSRLSRIDLSAAERDHLNSLLKLAEDDDSPNR